MPWPYATNRSEEASKASLKMNTPCSSRGRARRDSWDQRARSTISPPIDGSWAALEIALDHRREREVISELGSTSGLVSYSLNPVIR